VFVLGDSLGLWKEQNHMTGMDGHLSFGKWGHKCVF
jgi:hypothetical protein